ncbi:MAG: metallophosphoesterase [Anaerolineales bacterium]|nr:metallophosphoesterase [Anaerolineales bacterium]
MLKQINKPAVLVPGNSESAEELVRACADWPSAIVLHGDGVTVAGIRFFGLGGGIPVTPFGAWSYDFTDEEAAEMLSRCDHCDVLVSHSPPLDAVDLSSNGRRLGSPAIRTAVETIRPQLVVCGHIHASSGKQAKIGATTVINAGPAGLMFELTTSF